MSETTPGGSQIIRHGEMVDQGAPMYDEGLRAALDAVLQGELGAEPMILHEIVSEGVHLDVCVYPPTDERPVWTLVTQGMSERAMAVPEGAEEWRRCELVMTLPDSWPMPGTDVEQMRRTFADPEVYWPIRLLKEVGHLPHLYDSWVCYGHTLQAGMEDEDTYEGSEFSGVLLAIPVTLSPEHARVEHDGEVVHFWGMYPLYADEMAFKLEHGADALVDRLLEEGYYEGVHVGRPSVLEGPAG